MTSTYLREILEQPEAIRRCAGRFPSGHGRDLERLRGELEAGRFRNIVLTGMGSSLHGCYPLWLRLCQATSTPAAMVDASELAHFAADIVTDATLLIAVSQSGESAELRVITERGHRPGAAISVTNTEDNTLARWADIPLVTRAGAETAVSTKTYMAGVAVLHLLGCRLTGQYVEAAEGQLVALSSELERYLDRWEEAPREAAGIVVDCEALAFVGRGPSMASVGVATLVTQEAANRACMGFSGGQFRHGPLEMARSGFSAVIFAGYGTSRALNQRLAGEIARLGGRSLLVAPEPEREAADGVTVLPIPPAPPLLLPLLEIAPVQLLAVPLARAQGVEPGVFENVKKITDVE